MFAIYKRELNAYFTSPIAYVVYAVAAFFGGMYFRGIVLQADSSDMSYVFLNMTSIVIILMPILTMKLFSEEKNKKTEQGLLTAPVNLLQIVMGKFTAAVTVYAILMLLFVIYGIIKDAYDEPVKDAVVKLIEVEKDCGKEERKPVTHTFTDKNGEFVFGPLCANKFYEVQIWANDVKHRKICTTCHHKGKCLKGVDLGECDYKPEYRSENVVEETVEE